MTKKHRNYFYKYSNIAKTTSPRKNPFEDMANGTCGYTEAESARMVQRKKFWRWIGWKEFFYGVFYGATMTLAAAASVLIFYWLCVFILILEPML
jgi:hypothetical protein